MPTPFKHAILPISIVAALFIGGCNSENSDDAAAAVPKAQSYYKVRDIQPSSDGSRIFIASKEGFSIGRMNQGRFIVDKTYGEKNLVTPYMRFIAVDDSERYVVAGGQGGINICLLNSDDTLDATSSYFEGNNTTTAVLAGDLLIASTYHYGLKVGSINADTGTMNSVVGLDTASSPALPQNVVTALALGPSGEYVFIGMQREGVAVAHINAAEKRIDTVAPVPLQESGISFVSDIAVHSSGISAIVGKNGIAIARISGGDLQLLKHHTYPLLPFRQFTEVVISHDGKMIAAGTGGKGILLAALASDGSLSNLRILSTATTETLASDRIFSLAFSNDDSHLLVGSDSSENDNIVVIEL